MVKKLAANASVFLLRHVASERASTFFSRIFTHTPNNFELLSMLHKTLYVFKAQYVSQKTNHFMTIKRRFDEH